MIPKIHNKIIINLPDGGSIEYYSKNELLTKRESVYGDVYYRDTYNSDGRLIYRVTNGWWVKWVYDEQNRLIYHENSRGVIRRINFHYTKDGCVREEMNAS